MINKSTRSVLTIVQMLILAVMVLLSLLIFSVPGCSDANHLKDIRKSGSIRVLTRNNAHCYYIYRDEKMGFEYDLAREFANYLGVNLKVLTPSWEGLIEKLRGGGGDFIAASMTISEPRAELVDFSDVYMTVQQQVVVHKDNDQIRTIDDLAGQVVHVRKGTSYEQRLMQLRQEGLDVSIRAHDDIPTEEFIRMVVDKEIDLTVADSNIALLNRRYYPELRIAFPLEEPEGLGWAVAKGQNDLRQAINDFFNQIRKNGTFSKIYEKYYANVEIFDYVDLIKYHQRLETRLPKYEPVIRKAAHEHGFDWRLIGAMVYQESHFDPAAQSHTGVRGLMQLTLTTAQELGVKNRLDPVQSINGGVRYLKKLYNRFKDVPHNDRLRMALASYNVGMGHVLDARKIAHEKGLDQNSWRALKQTLPLLRYSKYYKKTPHGYCRGTEPVRYVNRIMIYYDILKREAIL